MDTTYLDELMKLSDNADKIVSEVHKANKRLHDEYECKEAVALDKFINDMRGLGGYAKKLNYKTFYTDIELDYYRDSFGRCAELIVRFYEDGIFALQSTAYTHHPYIYNDKYADCGRIRTDFGDFYGVINECIDGWSWNIDDSKRFIALNADKIYNRVYNMICERIAEDTKRKIASVCKRSEQLVNDITKLEN